MESNTKTKVENGASFINIDIISDKDKRVETFTKYGEDLVKIYTKKDILNISFKILIKEGNLLIFLNYLYSTDLNPFKDNIRFNILLKEDFPTKEPIVTCKTNFCFPTLYDNRDLLESILNHNWAPNKDNPITNIQEIILQIPLLLIKNYENISNRTLLFYGKYNINSLYNLNNFLENKSISIIKTMKYNKDKSKAERYLILTELYLLVFKPVENNKNLGTLEYYIDYTNIVDVELGKLHSSYKKESLIITFPNRKFEYMILNQENEVFQKLINKNKKALLSRFEVFHNENLNDEDINVNNLTDIDNIKNIIEYKEKLYERNTKKSLNLIKSLIALYEKIIEILSAKGDDSFITYLEKMKLMMKNEDNYIANQSQEENIGQRLFENCKVNHL